MLNKIITNVVKIYMIYVSVEFLYNHFNWDTVYLPMVITFTNIVTNYC